MLTLIQAIARQERGWGTASYSDPRNNPGDIEDGKWAQLNGALPSDGNRFAAWPTEEAGFNAMRNLLLHNYLGKTVLQAIQIWAPAVENDDATYVKNITNWTGLTADTELNAQNIG